MRSPPIKVGGKVGQFAQLPVGFGFLQLGQILCCFSKMYFLQRSHNMGPICPQPLQECGASSSIGLVIVVFFTIFSIILLILL